MHIFHSPVELSVLSENDWEPFAKTSVVCEERIVLPKLIPAPENNRCGKGLKPISGKAAHVGNKLVVSIVRSDSSIKVSEFSELTLVVRGSVGREGRLAEALPQCLAIVGRASLRVGRNEGFDRGQQEYGNPRLQQDTNAACWCTERSCLLVRDGAL